MADHLVALDVRDRPAVSFAGPETVLDVVAAHGCFRDIDQPHAGAADPTFTSHISLGEVPTLIQDADPRTLPTEDNEVGPAGWQAWAWPAFGAPACGRLLRRQRPPRPRRPVRGLPQLDRTGPAARAARGHQGATAAGAGMAFGGLRVTLGSLPVGQVPFLGGQESGCASVRSLHAAPEQPSGRGGKRCPFTSVLQWWPTPQSHS